MDSVLHVLRRRPLTMQESLEDVDGLEANVDDRRARLQRSLPQRADQILHAVGDG